MTPCGYRYSRNGQTAGRRRPQPEKPGDVNAGATFAVATATYALNWYLTQEWIVDWLKEVFKEASKGRDIDEQGAGA